MNNKLSIGDTVPINGEYFRIESLQLYNHKVLGNLTYRFNEEENTVSQTYFTVLIGPNGTGKSILLKTLLEIFRQIELITEVSENMFDFPYGFALRYVYGKERFEVGYFDAKLDKGPLTIGHSQKHNRKAFAIYSGTNIALDAPPPMPGSIIAQSQLITDKFLFLKKSEAMKSRYRYMGIRSEPQLASTRRYIRRSVEFIAKEKNRTGFLKNLKLLLNDFVGSYMEAYIVYYTKNTKKFFHVDVKPEDIDKHFLDMEDRYQKSKKQAPYALNFYYELRSSKEDVFQRICNLCIDRSEGKRLDNMKRSPSKGISYNILDQKEIEQFQKDFQVLDWMRQLEIVHVPEFEFYPGQHSNYKDPNLRYSFIESSSGEIQLISTFIGLLATLEPNSLIVIDEPEMSLHPNWQMRFIHFLKTILSGSGYEGCHFVIATHSHFLISGLDGSNSKIIGLTRDDKKIDIVGLPENLDTFGWSPDEVLYRVFKLRSSRNHFFEYDVRKLASLIEQKSKDREQLSEVLDKLAQYKYSANDPLNYLIKKGNELLAQLHA